MPPFPTDSSSLQPRPGLARLLGLARYAREAGDLVWQTDKRLTLGLVGLTLGAGALPAGIAYVGKLIIDGVTLAAAAPVSAPHRQQVFVLLAVELALVAVLVGLQRGLAVCDALLRVRLAQRVAELVLSKSLTLCLADFENAALYDQLQQVRAQAAERPLSSVRRAATALQLGVSLLGFLVLLADFSPWILLLLLATALPSVLAEARFNTDAFRLFRARSAEAREQAYLETVLTREDHAKEVMMLGLGPVLIERHRRIFHTLFEQDRRLTLRRSFWAFVLALLGVAALAASYAWVVWQAMVGVISIGTLAMLFAVLRQAQNAMTELLLVIAGMYDDNLYLSTLRDFLAYPTGANTGGHILGPTPGDGLRFEAVEFSYPGEAVPALRDFDLHLTPGARLALAGRNGAGKSTFVKLALGLYAPTRGRVSLDGRDLREWDRHALARRFCVFFQDFVRYQLLVSDNIGFGDVEHIADEKAWAVAARRAGLQDLIEHLPNGYRTRLGHWFAPGHELSLGEWQKLALARTFMRQGPAIVVLDEPSSSLDAQAEAEAFRELLAFTRDRSAIVISHRLATLRSADEILVLEGGRCVERGRHDELLAKGGPYAELFAKQASGYR